MEGEVLRDDQWERLREFVPGGRTGKRGARSDGRRFLDALLWLARTGGRWRDLPERFGPYQTAKRRYYRWVEQGVNDRIFEAVSDDPDIEWLAIDAAVICAQAQAVVPHGHSLRQIRCQVLGFIKPASIMLWLECVNCHYSIEALSRSTPPLQNKP